MATRSGFLLIALTLAAFGNGVALAGETSDADELKIAALEALMSAPPERALPIVSKVLRADHSDEVKESALFILSQIETPEAQAMLVDFARQSSGELQHEAIQMIGIGGDDAALTALKDIYAAGDSEVREAVLDAFLISDDEDAVYEFAANAANVADFEAAVEVLAAMGATDELRKLKEGGVMTEELVQAFAVAGDFETLRNMALDRSDPDSQVEAIGALGIIGNDQANATLVEMYRTSDDWDVKEAALEGMLISGYDDGVLELYRASSDSEEKEELLGYLSMMGSDEIWDLIDEALQ